MCEIMERERAEGMKAGREEGIRVFVEDHEEDGTSPTKIIAKLQTRFYLSEQDAVMYYQRFSCLTNNDNS